MKKKEYLEYRDDPLESVLDFKGLRKAIKDFKEDEAIKVLKNFRKKDDATCKPGRFRPLFPSENSGFIEAGIHNAGIFSTAVCLETIAAYRKNVDECEERIDGKEWVWDITKQRRTGKDRRKSSVAAPAKERRGVQRRKTVTPNYGKEKAYQYFDFIINGLAGDYGFTYGFLAKIATLVRFSNYLNHWEIKDGFIESNVDESIRKKFYEICLDCILEFHNRLSMQKESIHPFELYRFLQFVDKWGNEVLNILKSDKIKKEYISDKSKKKEFTEHPEELEKLKKWSEEVCSRLSEFMAKKGEQKTVFGYFFAEVYLFAKYELYRQMSLNQSGDSKLYDSKRLIYSLLIVYLDNKFSNTLVRNKALELIFSRYRSDKNAAWTTGQQVAMSKDGLMIITDNECVCDLLDCEALKLSLLNFIKELKYIYDGYARTKRIEGGQILGWYPIHQRDKTPTSWNTAFTLSFIKRFCKLISLELSRKAKERFRSNYRKPSTDWGDLYDSTAVKSKIRLMFPKDLNTNKDKDRDIIGECKYRTAILFGPPGTGKTTYGRALATKLGLDYLELTPGDFFVGSEDSILVTINDIFEHLLHLKNTVVFIDEIDDLVIERNPSEGKSYDRRSLFVNSLLPRFQELHDNENIILLMATNNIEKVDKAIKRMGRVDMIIPVGAMSPHGRLKYFHEFRKKHNDVFGKLNPSESDLMDLQIEYLDATEDFNFSILKHFSEMIVDDLRRKGTDDDDAVLKNIKKFLKTRIVDKDSLFEWKNNFITQDNPNNDTRPKHSKGDFRDFGYFITKYTAPEAKKQFQEAFIELFSNIRKKEINRDEASKIKANIFLYCNTRGFPITETSGRLHTIDPIFNIMTPFYDDIEDAIKRHENYKEVKSDLVAAKEKLDELIYNRSMLTKKII